MSLRTTSGLSLGILLLAAAGCTAPLFNVAPLPAAMPQDHAAVQMPGGLTVEASLVSETHSLDQFDANLPLAGIIALEARFDNQSNTTVTPARLRPELISDAGTRYKILSPSAALKRLNKFYGNTFYLVESYRRTRAAFDAVALPLNNPIFPGTDAHGFLFFKAPSHSAGLNGLVLSMKHGATPVTLKLN